MTKTVALIQNKLGALLTDPSLYHALVASKQPTFEILGLRNLPKHHFHVKVMVDGMPSRAFSASTLALDHGLR